RVQSHPDRVPLQVVHRPPEREEDVVGSTAEEECISTLERRGDVIPGRVVTCAPSPPASVEPVFTVRRGRTAISLSPPVEGDLRDRRQLHTVLPGLGARTSGALTKSTN